MGKRILYLVLRQQNKRQHGGIEEKLKEPARRGKQTSAIFENWTEIFGKFFGNKTKKLRLKLENLSTKKKESQQTRREKKHL